MFGLGLFLAINPAARIFGLGVWVVMFVYYLTIAFEIGHHTLADAVMWRIRTRIQRKTGHDHYASGAPAAGFTTSGQPVPVAPPKEVGKLAYLDHRVPNGDKLGEHLGVILDPANQRVLAAVEVTAPGGTLDEEPDQETQAEAWGRFLQSMAGRNVLFDRIQVLDIVRPETMSEHMAFVTDAADQAALRTGRLTHRAVEDSYQELAEGVSFRGEQHRYFVVGQITASSDVNAVVRAKRTSDDKSPDDAYARMAEDEVYKLVDALNRANYRVTRRLSVDDLAAITRATYDPSFRMDDTAGALRGMWPGHSENTDKMFTVTGPYHRWHHRTYFAVRYPDTRVGLRHFDPVMLMPALRPLIRTTALTIDLITPAKARRTAVSDMTADTAAENADLKAGKIDIDGIATTQSGTRLIDHQQGYAGATVTLYTTVSTTEADELDAITRTVHGTGEDVGLILQPLDLGHHNQGIATALPLALGLDR